jgi:hypothetical protein
MLHRPKIYPFYGKKEVFFSKTTQKSVYKGLICKNMFINHTIQAPQKFIQRQTGLCFVIKFLQLQVLPLCRPSITPPDRPFSPPKKNYILYIGKRE